MSNRPNIPPELATALRRFPAWHYWKGVSGLYYARRPKSSPPIVLRHETAAGLAALIAEWEAER
jgi:hypothetical protein